MEKTDFRNDPKSIKIRRMVQEDIGSIAHLWLEMMREHENRDHHFALAPGHPEEKFRQYLEETLGKQDAVVYVAETERTVVGYILALILENPEIFELRNYGFIGELSVSKDHRRQGIGNLLWDRARNWFRRRGMTVVQLNVSPKNESGLRFWESLGFRDFLEIKWCDVGEE